MDYIILVPIALLCALSFYLGHSRGDAEGYTRATKWRNDADRHSRDMMDIVFHNIEANAPTPDAVLHWHACGKKLREYYDTHHPAPKCKSCGR